MVVMTMATVRIDPSNADRTGAAVEPRPGSCAKRVPIVADGESPIAEVARTTRDARAGPNDPARRRRDRQTDTTTANVDRQPTRMVMAMPRTVQSGCMPRWG